MNKEDQDQNLSLNYVYVLRRTKMQNIHVWLKCFQEFQEAVRDMKKQAELNHTQAWLK